MKVLEGSTFIFGDTQILFQPTLCMISRGKAVCQNELDLFSGFHTVQACDRDGVVWDSLSQSRSLEIAPFDRARTSSY